MHAAQVGSRHKGQRTLHLNLGLEGVGRIGQILRRGAMVDQVDRDRACAGGQRDRPPVNGDRALNDLILEAMRIGDVMCRLRLAGQRHRHRHLALGALPDLRLRLARSLSRDARIRTRHSPFRTRHGHEPVVAPAQRHLQVLGLGGHQESQANGRGEEALLGRAAILVGLLVKSGLLRNLLRLIVLVRVAAFVHRRARRDEEAGQVPVGGPQVFGELLHLQGVSGTRADQIKFQGVNKLGADGEGCGRVGHTCSLVSGSHEKTQRTQRIQGTQRTQGTQGTHGILGVGCLRSVRSLRSLRIRQNVFLDLELVRAEVDQEAMLNVR